MKHILLSLLVLGFITVAGAALADEPLATLGGVTVEAMSDTELASVVGADDYLKNPKANSRSVVWSEDLAVGEAADGDPAGGNRGLQRAENRGRTPIDWNETSF